MGAEIGEQAIQIEWKATKITVAALKALIQLLVSNRGKIVHGQQSLKKLNLHGKKLESVEMAGEDIKAFRRELNRYAVDFSIKQDSDTKKYTVFFKGQDVERVYSGLEKCVANFDRTSKKPMKEVMEKAEQKAEERNANRKPPEHEQSVDRGKETR